MNVKLLCQFVRKLLILAIFLMLASFSHAETKPSPIKQLRSQVLSEFAELSSSNKFAIGQNIGHNDLQIRSGYQKYFSALAHSTRKTPALLGIDLGYNQIPNQFAASQQIVTRHWQSGGYVTLSMHPANPWRASDCNDTRRGAVSSLNKKKLPAGIRWQADLQRVADILTRLQEQRVIVLWRPLHEMNGGWFWWGGDKHAGMTKDEFVGLWKQMHRYLTVERRLSNLIWVYSPSVPYVKHHRDVLHYYPGDKFVDIVGLDYYSNSLDNLNQFGAYDQLAALNKPIGICELGPLPEKHAQLNGAELESRLKADYPRIGFVLYWHSWSDRKMSIINNPNARHLLHSPKTVTLNDLTPRQWSPFAPRK